MKIKNLFLLASICVGLNAHGQKEDKPYKCGFVPKSLADIQFNFEHFGKLFNCKSGEKIASVGASNGTREVEISTFIDSIFWTIQDIDTSCLNFKEFKDVITHHERLKGKLIKANFEIVIGNSGQTNLKKGFYDRIILCYVYHELTDKASVMTDIRQALNDDGVVVIMEDLAKRKGQKRACGHTMVWESDFLSEMKEFGFVLKQKQKSPLGIQTYFTFARN